MTAPYLPHRKPLDYARYQRMRSAGFSDEQIAADGFVIPQAPPKTRVGLVDAALDVGNEMLQSASFGYADEAAGLVSEKARDAMRQRSAAFNERSPKSAFAAQMLGGAATGRGGDEWRRGMRRPRRGIVRSPPPRRRCPGCVRGCNRWQWRRRISFQDLANRPATPPCGR